VVDERRGGERVDVIGTRMLVENSAYKKEMATPCLIAAAAAAVVVIVIAAASVFVFVLL